MSEVIHSQLVAGDPLFAPSRAVIQAASGPYGVVAGSEQMRATAWSIVRVRFEAVVGRARALVDERRASIEHLARTLLDAKATLTGDEIAAAIEDSQPTRATR